MATGMAIMGFGGGAMIGSPLATILMNGLQGGAYTFTVPFTGIEHTLAWSGFRTATNVGVWQTFIAMAAIYFAFMLIGAFGYRLPPAGWQPEGWAPPANGNRMITSNNVHLKDAHKTPQFWLLWLILCLNVSAGIGIIGAASPMLQETFGGQLIGQSALAYLDIKKDVALAAKAAAVGAGFVGLISLFNIFGRAAVDRVHELGAEHRLHVRRRLCCDIRSSTICTTRGKLQASRPTRSTGRSSIRLRDCWSRLRGQPAGAPRQPQMAHERGRCRRLSRQATRGDGARKNRPARSCEEPL